MLSKVVRKGGVAPGRFRRDVPAYLLWRMENTQDDARRAPGDFSDFFDFLVASGYRPNTQNTILCCLKRFGEWLAGTGKALMETAPADIANFCRCLDGLDPPYSPSYKSHHAFSLRLFFRWAVNTGALARDPALGANVPNWRGAQRDGLGTEETAPLFDHCADATDRLLLCLFYSLGLRLEEARSLKWGHVSDSFDRVVLHRSKFGRKRCVPVVREAAETLRGAFGALCPDQGEGYVLAKADGGRLSASAIGQRLAMLGRRAGLEGKSLTPHLLRHSIARHLYGNGMPVAQVSKFLGHRSLASTEVYVKQGDPFECQGEEEGAEAGPVGLEEGFACWLRKGHTPGTAKRYLWTVSAYLAARPDPVAETPAGITAYVAWLRRSGQAKGHLNAQVAALKRFFLYLMDSGLRERSPLSGFLLKDARAETPLFALFSPEELEQALCRKERYPVLAERNRCALLCLVELCLRPGELSSLRTMDYDKAAGTLRVAASKNARGRVLACSDRLRASLDTYLQKDRPKLARDDEGALFLGMRGGPVAPEDFSGLLGQQKQCFPGRKLNCKTVRMSRVAHLLAEGADPVRLSEFTGHRHASSLERYLPDGHAALLEALERRHPQGSERPVPDGGKSQKKV